MNIWTWEHFCTVLTLAKHAYIVSKWYHKLQPSDHKLKRNITLLPPRQPWNLHEYSTICQRKHGYPFHQEAFEIYTWKGPTSTFPFEIQWTCWGVQRGAEWLLLLHLTCWTLRRQYKWKLKQIQTTHGSKVKKQAMQSKSQEHNLPIEAIKTKSYWRMAN